jgi:putative ABC transport system permease protein
VRDLRLAIRLLAISPGFTVVAILALALGIGATTSIFSVVNAVLLKPLPFEHPDRLVMVWESRNGKSNVVNPFNFLEWRDRNHSFERLAAMIQIPMNLAGEGEPEQVQGMLVTDGFFDILGIKPLLGRTFRPEEDTPGATNAVVLSHELWQRRWAGDAAVVGRKVRVNSRSVEIVGVMPAAFRFPNTRAELWIPFGLPRTPSGGRSLSTVGRLRPGATLESAQAEMDVLAGQLRAERPEFNAKWGIMVVGLPEQSVGEVRTPLVVLLGAVGFVLLIACANIANLMLIRATARERELAIRAALGASRWRLARQLLVESVTLAVAGGVLGVAVSVWATRALVALIPESIAVHNVAAVGIDRNVLAFAILATVATGVLFGLAPALWAGRRDLHDALKEGARGATTGRSRTRAALVVAEVALSMVLLVGAGLLIRSFARLIAVDPGFASERVLTMRLSTAGRFQRPQQAAAFLDAVLERVRALPGVSAAGSIHFLPLSGLLSATGFWRDDRPQPRPGDALSTQTFVITPGYFAAMGIPLARGRLFDQHDRDGAPLVTVANAELASRFFPGEDPIGKRLHIQWGRPETTYEIVGVVGSIRHRGLDKAPEPALFLASGQEPHVFINLVVRASADPMSLVPAIKSEVRAVDRDIPISEIRTMDEYLTRSMARPRFNLMLIASFAALALVLAAVGLFGVVAYSVAQRTHEIGIRRALGADDRTVVMMVVKQGMMLAAGGVALGLAGSFALTRFLETLLFAVKPTDAPTYATVAAVLIGVALLASYLPARRAARVDPLSALRHE